MPFCPCPIVGTITSISNVDCYEKFGAIERVALFRKVAGTNNYASMAKFDANAVTPNPITTEAAWDAFLTAVDDEKVVLTPLFTSAATGGGEERTFGGNDNSTIGGVPISLGSNFVDFTFEFQDLPGFIVEEIRDLLCEKGLMVIFIDEFGAIIAKEVTTDAYTGFESVGSPYISSKSFGGRTEPNRNAMSIKLRGDWDSGLKVVSPNFDIYNKLNP